MVRNIAILSPLLLATVALGLALVVGLWPSGQADASGHSATRSLSPTSVAPGGEITVTIAATNYGSFGQVVETLPDGFSYVANSVSPSNVRVAADGQDVKFTLLGTQSFSYKVTASNTAGEHTFEGMLRDDTGSSQSIVGASDVTVTGAPGPTPDPTPPVPSNPRATRSLPTAPVAPGGEITVTIAATNYGSFGQVVETLPDGFSYVADSVSPSDVRVVEDGQDVKFTLLGTDQGFNYKVTAPSGTGSYDFSGVLKDDQEGETSIGGASRITVGTAPPRPRPRPPANNPPVFPFDTVVYNVPENLPPGANVGEPVIATDPDGDTLTYTLSGADAAAFRIDSASGQIAVGPDTSLDYETKPFYALAVMASDGNNASDTTDVIVNVTEVEEPSPTGDPCRETLSGDGAFTGQWAAGCESAVGARGYARYYTFTLAESSEVTIALESSRDPYLYLREGEAKSGDFLHENDDVAPGTNSRIQETLAAGTYTIEATTFNTGEMGSFTLTVSGLGSTTTPPPTGDPCRETLSGDGAFTGQWAAGCESAVGARGYARYYTFTLAESSEVTIALESSRDPYLYLREGEAKSGDFLHENDDIVSANTNSRIQETLAAGTYTIEATTFTPGEMGSFTLTVSGLGSTTTRPTPTGDPCVGELSGDSAVTGQWAAGCESAVGARGYARYYTFTLAESSEVTIALESSLDPYLYLREGEAKSGDFLHENDDIVSANTNSRIQETLAAGTYTIEATTFTPGEMGSFTLTVSGLGAAVPAQSCTVGLELDPGDRCGHRDFSIEVDSSGTAIMRFTGDSVDFDNLTLARNANSWTIESLR